MTTFLLLAAGAAFICLALLGLAMKLLFWVVLLPIRLFIALVAGAFGLLFAALAAPILILVAVVASLAVLVALMLPLLPLLVLGCLGWLVCKGVARRPSPAI